MCHQALRHIGITTVAIVLGCWAPTASAATFDDGGVHTISDGHLASDFVLLGNDTTLEVTPGAEIGTNALLQSLIATAAEATVTGGELTGGVELAADTEMVVQGGVIGFDQILRSVFINDSSLAIDGGLLRGSLSAVSGSHISVAGGEIAGRLTAFGDSTVTVSGGLLRDIVIINTQLELRDGVTDAIGAEFGNHVTMLGGTVKGPLSMHAGNETVIEGGFIGKAPISGYSVNGFDLNRITIRGGETASSIDLAHNNLVAIEGGLIGANDSGHSVSMIGHGNDVSIAGGELSGGIVVHDGSSLHVTGGTIGKNHDHVSLDATGGDYHLMDGQFAGALHATEAVMTIAGGVFGVDMHDAAVVANASSRVDLYGGLLAGELQSLAGSAIYVHGSNFAVDGKAIGFGPIDALDGQLTGTLADGAPLAIDFSRDVTATLATVLVVPEPGALHLWLVALLTLGASRATFGILFRWLQSHSCPLPNFNLWRVCDERRGTNPGGLGGA